MALQEARLARPNENALHQDIIMTWSKMLPELDLSVPPPVIASHLSALIKKKTGCGDLYKDDKFKANQRVLALLPSLKKKIDAERDAPNGDPLGLALELAIVGNYIDRGIDLDVDWEAELNSLAGGINPQIFFEFRQKAVAGGQVLILGDNTGEIVLDMLLVEELQSMGCHVTYAVRSQPVINDATLEDAQFVGMTRLCDVVESGVDTPGTVVDRCLPDFLQRMQDADLILAKGQGNFESLEGVWPGIYCAFKVKCQRVADDSGLPFGRSAFCLTSVEGVGHRDGPGGVD